MLRGDAVKRILARMAAIVLDVIARPLRCAGQASDAVSVHTQVKIEDARALLKLPNSQNGPSQDTILKIFVGRLERNLCGHFLPDSYEWDILSNKNHLGNGRETSPTRKCLFLHR